ncbi:hypothetical protein CISIN_1g044025mg [Citrus sinensis]|uniref:Uncharacterized protein n=1 Tax=Citrus sinensis TaxID=2711 RepID=A0A067D9J2_CITSI|nr:hypothetical protein CISIN_1g044025mg [Citrus sinensis]
MVIQQKNPKLPLSKLKENTLDSNIVVCMYTVIVANIILLLVHLLQHAELEIKEATWAISSATYGGSHEHIQFLVSQGYIKPLCDLLVCSDQRIVTVCLNGNRKLGMDNRVNVYTQMINECDGLDKIENL